MLFEADPALVHVQAAFSRDREESATHSAYLASETLDAVVGTGCWLYCAEGAADSNALGLWL